MTDLNIERVSEDLASARANLREHLLHYLEEHASEEKLDTPRGEAQRMIRESVLSALHGLTVAQHYVTCHKTARPTSETFHGA